MWIHWTFFRRRSDYTTTSDSPTITDVEDDCRKVGPSFRQRRRFSMSVKKHECRKIGPYLPSGLWIHQNFSPRQSQHHLQSHYDIPKRHAPPACNAPGFRRLNYRFFHQNFSINLQRNSFTWMQRLTEMLINNIRQHFSNVFCPEQFDSNDPIQATRHVTTISTFDPFTGPFDLQTESKQLARRVVWQSRIKIREPCIEQASILAPISSHFWCQKDKSYLGDINKSCTTARVYYLHDASIEIFFWHSIANPLPLPGDHHLEP